LRQKLVEEALEALDSKSVDELVSELADVQEVISGICAALQVTSEQLETDRRRKHERRGGFDNGVMLKRTSMPGSLSAREAVPGEPALSIDPQGGGAPIILESSEIPTSPAYRRADLRNVDQRPEKILTFETELNKIGTAKETTSFVVPVEKDSRHFTLTVELTRSRSSLRGTVRLRLEPAQLAIKLPEPKTE